MNKLIDIVAACIGYPFCLLARVSEAVDEARYAARTYIEQHSKKEN